MTITTSVPARAARLASIVMILLSAGCNRLGGQATIQQPKNLPPMRTLLVAGEQESDAYGFYTYLVFAEPPTARNLQRYRRAVDAYLGIVDGESDGKPAPQWQVNVTYLPVTKRAPAQNKQLGKSPLPGTPARDKAIDWLLTHHDYARSQRLLSHIQQAGGPGPFLISCARPLEQMAPDDPVSLLDLTQFEPEVIWRSTRIFLDQIARRRMWHGEAFDDWTLHLKNLLIGTGKEVARVAKAISILAALKPD